MKTCKVCSKQYRTGRIAFVMTDKGLKGARICQPCAKDGVLLVAAKPAVTKVIEKGGSVAPEVLKNLKAQVKALKSLRGTDAFPCIDPEREEYINGKIEGMENAIAALKA